MSTSNAWLWAIPALPFATFLVNGGLYLAANASYARKHATAGPHGAHGHDHAHGAHGHDHAHGAHGQDHAHGDHAHGDHGHGDHGHGDHGDHHAHATPGERVGLSAPIVAAIALVGPVIAFALSVMALMGVHEGAGPVGHYFEWITAGAVSVGFSLQVDALTGVMLMNVAGVGSLIHLYSYGYMKDDVGFARFMAYLNLFLSAMLILVMADNLPLMFVGWEGVGVCSYLLISFWYHDPPNVDAARKAFVVNRVGDLAFLLGVFGLFSLYGSVGFAEIEAGIGHADLTVMVEHGPLAGMTLGAALAFCAGCLFFGATGKSAQIPLYTWLPDAMAGPTPVSALIHAATMVTAGVYLLGRLDFLYVLLPEVTAVVALVAAATALLSGTIAVAQTDIKKVLAYSTVSQLGFMFCGMASALFVGGLFHVVTHAFFKALLFLGAGAVIHALGGEQDIRKMGGLRKDMPLIAGLFAIGSLALAGVPPFAGFWSKDEVLAGVHLQMSTAGGLWVAVWWMLLLTALLTAFYTTRLVVIVFFGPPADPNRHPHPVHWSMTSVLAVLAVLSAFGGGLAGPLEHFTHPVWAHADIPHEALHHSHNTAMAFSLTVVALGVGSAAFLYGMRREMVAGLVSGPLAGVHRVVENKFFVDELYDLVVVGPIHLLAQVLFSEVDRKVIDAGMVEGPGKAALAVGTLLQRTQPGPVAAATAGMTVGAAAVLGYLLWVAYV